MMSYRYSAWDGSQEPFHPSPDAVLDGLTDYLLQDGDLHKALRMLMQRGMMDRQGRIMHGLQDVLNQVRAAKEEQLRQYNPDSVVADLQRQLDDIVARERQTLDEQLAATRQRAVQLSEDEPVTAQQRANEARAIQEIEEIVTARGAVLDNLPDDVAATMRRLQHYDFVDRQARADFEALLQSLQQQALEPLLQLMQQRLQQMSAEDVPRLRQMIADLNRLLEQRGLGKESDFQDFLQIIFFQINRRPI